MINPAARIAGALTTGSFAGAWAAVRGLPEPVARRLFDAGADLAAVRGGKGVDRLRANLERVAPGQELTREALRSYARYWCEVFRLPSTPLERVVDRTVTVQEDVFRGAVANPRGCILALPHSGNWDAAGAWCVATGVPFTTVAERLKPESLYDRFVAFRESLGMEVVPLTGGARPPYEVLEERLAGGGTLCLMADRDLTPRGVDVQFFDGTARMPAGPSRLALESGASLLPVTLAFTENGWEIDFHDPLEHSDVATMTQGLADAFAEGIAKRPQDWHMLQRVWLDDLDADDPRRERQA
ncbi:MAG TPA: phosphatidylinositol mannoside acyltransferase [Mycobacteriales bacterium]|nr:phosphatidylinositol mannoside acyltransferase [Mycobacteriales bacterium]